MDVLDGKQRHSNADLPEAALWYLRSKSKYLSRDEMRELASWLRRSPENASALLAIAAGEHRQSSRHGAFGTIKQMLMCAWQVNNTNSKEYTEHRTLSYRYLDHIKRKYLFPRWGLIALALCGLAAWMSSQDVRALKIAVVAFAGCLLLTIRQGLIRLRVASGDFGSTESEARELIKFVIASVR